ncbi:MAG: heme biosynthesis protein HemY [Paracoccaceae bacterium]|nr:heme biosynthesis protein HemY [Paracoccaceae bacterium]
MLWSLFKIVLFMALVLAAAMGLSSLSDVEGGLRIAFDGIELNLQPVQTVVLATALVFVLWLFFKLVGLLFALVRFINGDETALSRYFDRNRERRGFEALAEGMTALASGEGRLAMAKATKAEKYLRRPELTNLINAQAAEMIGDRKKAEEVYKRLLQDNRTRFVGVRGLMRQRLEDGDTETAMKLAEKAFALKPKHTETGDILLRLQAENRNWKGARATLGEKLRQGELPRDLHKRRDAVLALSEAQEVFREGNTIDAREAAILANRHSPDLVPAAVMAADALIEDGKAKQAARVLRKAWEVHPHPDLASAFARVAPEETPKDRITRFGTLVKPNPEDPESRMLMAELHVSNSDFIGARAALGDLAERDPTARSLALLAAIERGEGNEDSLVRGILARAVTAPRGPQWVCDNCQNVHAAWAPVCGTCGAFDTFSWRRPVETELALPASDQMMPLIIGKMSAPDTAQKSLDQEAEKDPRAPSPDGNEELPEPKAQFIIPDDPGTKI